MTMKKLFRIPFFVATAFVAGIGATTLAQTAAQTVTLAPGESVTVVAESVTPPVTEPPVTEPPVTEPPVTEPPVTEPPVTEPPVTEPPVTEPPVTEPPVTEPPVTEPPVTEPPPVGPQFTETFDTASSLDRLGSWVYHRNVDYYNFRDFSGGSWQGDHSLDGDNCGTPDTTRTLSWDKTKSQDTRRANSLYWCPNGTGHFMTSMGDVDAFSIVAVYPKQVFPSVESVCVDVSLTDLGNRQWLKFGVVSDTLFNSVGQNDIPGYVVSDVSASGVLAPMAGSDRMIATWSGGISAGHPGGLKIGDTGTNQVANPTPNSKVIRHPVCLTDNGDGTVTFTVAGESTTQAGSFPSGPVRVVLYQNSYTPSKSETGSWGTTFHWDNLIVT